MLRNDMSALVRKGKLWVGALACLAALGGCVKQEESTAQKGPAPDNELRILAGSELQDLAPFVAAMEKAAGKHITFVYKGSLDAVEALEAGEQFDAVWLSHGKYLQLTGSLKDRVKASERTMASPVILGVKRSKAEALGWLKRDPTWQEVAQAAAQGKLSYAMTSPASSNSGLSALVGVAAALSGSGDALDAQHVQSEALAKLFQGQKFIAGSSGWLADAYIARQSALDGLVNYESTILQLNAGGKLREALVPVYPKEGIITADYPLMLLSEPKREAYAKLVAFLRSPQTQEQLSASTLRRPVSPGAKSAAAIPSRVLVELPFPSSRATLDALMEAYQSTLRRPASTYFVLDTSGSMQGQGLAQLQEAIAGMAGTDTSLTGRFARFLPREKVVLQPFSDKLGSAFEVTVPAAQPDKAPAPEALAKVREFSARLQAGGGTAIYSAVAETLSRAAADRAGAPNRQYGVVLMTDGLNTEGINRDSFKKWYRASAAQGIPVFVVLFGSADADELKELAELTGGRVFDGRSNMRTAFKQIRGYL